MQEYTTLVIGAGASKPYGLPLGVELRDEVATLRPTEGLDRILAASNLDRDDLRDFQEALKHSGEPTVDAFLDKRPKYSQIGRTAMAHCLLRAENPERLQAGECPKDHWLEKLWGQIRKDKWNDFKKTKVRIINFNYDRLVEYYLTMVICSNYKLKPSTVFKWITEEMVFHPHGTLGLGDASSLDDIIPMLYWRIDQRILVARESMYTITEAAQRQHVFEHVRGILRKSKTIAFAGFGYHPENMARMGFPSQIDLSAIPKFYASRKGLTLTEWRNICWKYLPGAAASSQTFPTLSRLIVNSCS